MVEVRGCISTRWHGVQPLPVKGLLAEAWKDAQLSLLGRRNKILRTVTFRGVLL